MTTASPIAALMMTDSYKLGHRGLLPPKTTRMYSNWTNRGSRVPGVNKVVHFGLQATLQRYLVEAWAPFFEADEDEVANLYEQFIASFLGPEHVASIGSDHIRALHRLGYLPLRFCAVPEGTRVPLRVPTFTVENTLPEFTWLTNYVETPVSASYWHPSTVATIANEYRILLEGWAAKTSDSPAAVDFQAHDFSFRGMTSPESAAASGAAHLTSFLGTDGLPTIDFINRYYPGDNNGFIAGSVPATEHSTMCAGSQENELDTYSRILDAHPSGIVSVVSDTWSIWDVILEILPQLKDRIMARDGKLVIRPDSGDPADILCGDPTAPKDSPAYLGVVRLLHLLFGGTVNSKGYIEIDSHAGVIYGDSITLDRAEDICDRLEKMGFASTNVVFGIGSYTYQYLTRDTFGSAIKATWVEVDGEGRNMQKNPVTDSGLKKSATGRLAVVYGEDGEMVLIQEATPEQEAESLLQPVWEDGKAVVTQSLADIRAVLAADRR